MTQIRIVVLVAAVTASGISAMVTVARPEPAATFNRDVLPILQENCQSCHRPGEIGPMAFTTYEGTRPWAKAIKSAVISKEMPPWRAEAGHSTFRNVPKLTDSNIRTLSAWADSGAPEGEAADKPVPVQWQDGWQIQPDVVASMPQPFRVPAQGAGEVREFFVPNPFKEDTWVTSIEVRPGNRSVVHHVILQIVNPAEEIARQTQFAGTPFLAAASALVAMNRRVDGQGVQNFQDNGSAYNGTGEIFARAEEMRTGQGAFMTMEAVYAPGSQAMDFRYAGSAKLIHGGGQMRIEVHYTPNGKETTDQTKIGFTLAKAPVKRSFVLMAPQHLAETSKPIPAGESNWETTGEITFSRDAELVWFMPHMHLRGKDMTFQLTYPDGRVETVLNVKYNFNWQLGYELATPIKVPRGTRMLVTAHHDNSANNKLNPEPGKDVAWGDLTGQEMMLPWFGVVVDRDASPATIAVYQPRGLLSPDAIQRLSQTNNAVIRLDDLLMAPGVSVR